MQDCGVQNFLEDCKQKAWRASAQEYCLSTGVNYKQVIDDMLSEGGLSRLQYLDQIYESKEYLQSYWETPSAAFYLNNVVREDREQNYRALKPKEAELRSALKAVDKRQEIQYDREKDDTLENEGEIEACEKGKQQMLSKEESSSLLIDKSEFDVIDQAYKPGFVFEEYFKRDEANANGRSWETKMHDIYEPMFTSKNDSPEGTLESNAKDKKNFGIKYSFQVDAQKLSTGGLDYFLSETNMLDYRANMRSLQGDSIKNSPMLSKGKITTNTKMAPMLMPKSKNLQAQKDKEIAPQSKPKMIPKKAAKKQAFIQFKPGKKGQSNTGGAEEVQNFKFKPTDAFFAKNFNPQTTIIRTLKKKNSVLFIQTRSNSREHTGEYKAKDAMRSTTKERDVVINKKKMRIRERGEQVPAKDITNSVVIKKRKKKIEATDTNPESSLISKLLFKSLKQKNDQSTNPGSLAGGLHMKPSINLENSYLTDDFQGRLFESCQQKSPKFVKAVGHKSKLTDFAVDSNSKLKSHQSGVRQVKRCKKKAKSCNKKKPSMVTTKQMPSLLSGYHGAVLCSPPEVNLRSSLEKISGVTRYMMGKAGKRNDIEADLLTYNQMNLKLLDQKAREYWRSRPNTADEVPYFSQRSKTTNKKNKEKRGISKKKDEHSREPLRYLNGLSTQFSSINSPSKNKHFGKNSSSLIER